MQDTGRDLDVAVNGKGYIAVRGADGKEAYTRAGDLQVSAEGAVTTGSGLPVLSESGPINLPAATSITVGNDGTISVLPVGLQPVRSGADRPHQAGQSAGAELAEGRRRFAATQGWQQGPRRIRR